MFNHDTPHEHRVACDTGCEYGGSIKCVPVEPERVTGWCGREQGPCYLPGSNPDPQKWCFDGARDCYCRWFHDPSWAQMAGMLERELEKDRDDADWLVVEFDPNGEPAKFSVVSYSSLKPASDLPFWLGRRDRNRRAFRWSSGERG